MHDVFHDCRRNLKHDVQCDDGWFEKKRNSKEFVPTEWLICLFFSKIRPFVFMMDANEFDDVCDIVGIAIPLNVNP